MVSLADMTSSLTGKVLFVFFCFSSRNYVWIAALFLLSGQHQMRTLYPGLGRVYVSFVYLLHVTLTTPP